MNKPNSAQRDANLRERIARWHTAFCDDATGIHRTLDHLVWSYAAFRTTIQIVRFAGEKGESRPPINKMVFKLISEGYWSNLLLGIRRVLDGYPIKGGKGVYSLRSVLDDVKSCRELLTRRVYVEWVRDANHDLLKSEYSHRDFDMLSGVSEMSRSAEDIIDPLVFVKIETQLSSFKPIEDFVNSYLAHSGNAESREGKALDDFDIRRGRQALLELKQIVDLVGVLFANRSRSGLATYLGNQFEGLDTPLVETVDMKLLEDQWLEVDRDVKTWSTTAKQLLA